jgi:pyridoxine 5-phosphate synthase
MISLSINLNAVALLRNRRDLPWPDVCDIGRLALGAGAQGLTVHPRPDERHIRRQDVYDLAEMIRREYPDKEYNIEGFPDERWLGIVEDVRPDQATLVPDAPDQATSDHGWDFAASRDFLAPIVERLKKRGIRVSLFANPEPEGLEIARDIGADRIEIYTGPYGQCYDDQARQARELQKIALTAQQAQALRLGVNAGHDLTVQNLTPLVMAVPNLDEVSIGHAVTADALKFGMAETVRRFRRALGDPAA